MKVLACQFHAGKAGSSRSDRVTERKGSREAEQRALTEEEEVYREGEGRRQKGTAREESRGRNTMSRNARAIVSLALLQTLPRSPRQSVKRATPKHLLWVQLANPLRLKHRWLARTQNMCQPDFMVSWEFRQISRERAVFRELRLVNWCGGLHHSVTKHLHHLNHLVARPPLTGCCNNGIEYGGFNA